MVYPYNKILHSNKKEQTTHKCKTMCDFISIGLNESSQTPNATYSMTSLRDALRKDKSEGQKLGQWLPRSRGRDTDCIQGDAKVFGCIVEIFYSLIVLVVTHLPDFWDYIHKLVNFTMYKLKFNESDSLKKEKKCV